MNKNKKIMSGRQIILIIVIALILVVLIYKIYNLIIKPTDTFLVETGNLSQEQSVQGYVIRDEQVIKGENYKNGMEKIKAEGEKVAKGEEIFRYYISGEDEIKEKIAELDIKISEVLEKQKNSMLPLDVKKIENQIDEKINSVYKLNDLQKIKEYKTDMNNYINKKAQIAGELSPAGSYLKELITQRSNYENELTNGSEYIKATRAGIVSYRVDGLENELTINNFGNLSKKKLEDLNLKTGQIISTSEESGKIINNYECYIVTILKNMQEVKVGDTLKIRLSNNNEINAQVEYTSKESENETLIVFKIRNYVESLIDYRKISFDIIWWSASGLKVPNEALKKQTEDVSYVIRQKNGYTDKIYVKILEQNENYSIIDNYTASELIEKGIPEEDLIVKYTISMYDEIVL